MRETRVGLLSTSILGAAAGAALIFGAHPHAVPLIDAIQSPGSPVVSKRAVSPVAISIPSIGVKTSVLQLGLTTTKALAVPPMDQAEKAGWYVNSATPGETGSSIIVGHVDSDSGPAVFYHLSSVQPGALVDVLRSDGRTAAYSVTSVRTYAKAHFPTSTVYAPSAGASLRLITCSPPYDPAHGGYESNLVVFAQLQHLSPSGRAR